MMLASNDDQSALAESNGLCNYIINEVFNHVAGNRNQASCQSPQVPTQSIVPGKTVKKMAKKIAKRMKRSES